LPQKAGCRPPIQPSLQPTGAQNAPSVCPCPVTPSQNAFISNVLFLERRHINKEIARLKVPPLSLTSSWYYIWKFGICIPSRSSLPCGSLKFGRPHPLHPESIVHCIYPWNRNLSTSLSCSTSTWGCLHWEPIEKK
jgi:hypothetical protein